MSDLSGSVGLAGDNRHYDVVAVQKSLTRHRVPTGAVDGRCGRLTIGAIAEFQKTFMHEPDGRIDVHGPTWRKLQVGSDALAPQGALGEKTPGLRSHNGFPPSATHAASPPAPARATEVTNPMPAPPAGGLHYTDHLPLPPPGTVNLGITSPPNILLKAKFGAPRENFSTDCRPPTNQRLAAAIVTRDVGPFRATGLRPAVTSLSEIFAEVRRDHPDLHGKLGTAGMICCRLVRGSSTSISNHSWGTAIDMKVEGALVPWRSNYVSIGLAMIAPYFNKHGWFWGAGYRESKDPHHFECGSELIKSFSI